MLDLNLVGVLEGTDKSSSVAFSWDYLRHYEQLFSPWKEESINLIEIGVSGANSLHVWLSYFSKATIIGIDINQACSRYSGERINIRIGSQDDPVFMHKVCADFPPTIIIDDGSHQAHHNIFTFENIFHRLSPGGLYIIEDLAFHFGKNKKKWAKVDGYDTPSYFLDLANSCMKRENPNLSWGTKRSILSLVDSIQFINGAVCIKKKTESNHVIDVNEAVNYINSRSLGHQGLLRLAKYLLQNQQDISDILIKIQHYGLANKPALYIKELAELQRDAGNTGIALKTLSEGVQILPNNPDLLWRYGHWLCHYGSSDDGIRTLEKAAQLSVGLPFFISVIDTLIHFCINYNQQEVAIAAINKCAARITNPELSNKLMEKVLAFSNMSSKVSVPSGPTTD